MTTTEKGMQYIPIFISDKKKLERLVSMTGIKQSWLVAKMLDYFLEDDSRINKMTEVK